MYKPLACILVYVIAWAGVVFGIDCVSNVCRKLVIVGAEHYYFFLPALQEQLIPNTSGKPCYYKLMINPICSS